MRNEAIYINFSGVSTAPGLLVQIAPFTNNADISVSQNGTIGTGFRYAANDFLNAFTGTTAVLGHEDYIGNIIFEETIPFSSKNLLALTRGSVLNIGNVITSGIVAIVPIFGTTSSILPTVTSPSGGTTSTSLFMNTELSTISTSSDDSSNDDDDNTTGDPGSSTQLLSGGLIELQQGGTSSGQDSQSCT